MSRKSLHKLPAELLGMIIEYMASSRYSWSLIRSTKTIFHVFNKEHIYKIDAKALQPRALLWAASRGDMTVLKAALDAGTDIDTQFSHSFSFGDDARHGLTSIMAAAAAGHEEIVRHLLDNGASPRGMDQTGLNALHYAARGGHGKIVKLLLKHSPTLIYDYGQHGIKFGLPAPYAADRKSILERLLEAMNEEMRGSSLEAAVSHGDDDFFDILVKAGVLMDSSSLLETAFLGNTEGHVKIAKALLENHEPVIGDRALTHICQSNGPYAFEMAQICLNKRVKPIPAKSSDPLPLEAACRVGNLNLIKLLLDAGDGCKNKYTKKHYEEIREAICQSADMECYKLIRQRLPLVTFNGKSGAVMVNAASCHNDEKTVRQILELSSSHELSPDKNDLEYALREAWQHGNAEMMESLLIFGVDTKLTDSTGTTILNQDFWALGDEEQQVLCLELLLRYGADPMAKNRDDHTALHMACYAGSVKCARLLLDKYSAKSQILDSGDFSPLRFAVMSGEPEMVKELVGQGARITPIYGDNHTMLHEACRLPEPDEMIQYVLQLTGGSIDLGSDFQWDQPSNGWVLRYHEAPERRQLINPNSWRQWRKPSFLNGAKYTSLTYLLELSKLSLSSDTLEQLVKASGDDLDKLLIVACEQGHYDAVELLIKCGANPNGGLNGVGPLCCAVTSYHLDIVKLLVARGAKIDDMIHVGIRWVEEKLKESLARHGGIRKFLLASGADLDQLWKNPRRDYLTRR